MADKKLPEEGKSLPVAAVPGSTEQADRPSLEKVETPKANAGAPSPTSGGSFGASLGGYATGNYAAWSQSSVGRGQIPPDVKWQWKHRTGFKDYDQRASARIERAFQNGDSHVRLKTGKFKKTPMEIFFVDMIQHDPVTGNNRDIRREGPDTRWSEVKRHIKAWLTHLETGRPRRLQFKEYEEQRKQLLGKMEAIEYKASDFYYEYGCLAETARSMWFQLTTMVIIVLNTMWMGIDAQFNTGDETSKIAIYFEAVENVFCVLFTIELLIRFCAFERKMNCFYDPWFAFDAALVVCMLVEAWAFSIYFAVVGRDKSKDDTGSMSVLRLLRLLRLTRLGRVVRLLRLFPDVLYMLKGILLAIRSVLCTVALLIVLMFLFAIIFRQQAVGDDELEEMFPSVTEAMWVLLLHGTLLDDVTDAVGFIRERSTLLIILFLVYVFIGCWTILNMLVGIIVEVVSTVSQNEKEEAAVLYLKSTLTEILECHDKDDDRHIHRDEFEMLLHNPDMHSTLTKFGVSIGDLIALKDVLFEQKRTQFDDTSSSSSSEDEGSSGKRSSLIASGPGSGSFKCRKSVAASEVTKVSFSVFLEAVLRLRGANHATVRDLTDLREFIRHRFDDLEDHVSHLHLGVSREEMGSTDYNGSFLGLREAAAHADGMAPAAPALGGTAGAALITKQDLADVVSSISLLRDEVSELRSEMAAMRTER
eukprot:TRINITY_DN25221_c0_g1_i1.p1 TRINITY_DN25221_c0_g1~~TRINITY_DN25221_c0_g1_i1.p1  ORF type:complete len:703 (+),score=146.60 TRINITY_DN25221_c0_g1_i1:98-2206(+)